MITSNKNAFLKRSKMSLNIHKNKIKNFKTTSSTGIKSKNRTLSKNNTDNNNQMIISDKNLSFNDHSSKIDINKIYTEVLELRSKNKHLEEIKEVYKEKIDVLMSKLRNSWDEKETFYSKATETMSDLLITVEQMKRDKLIRDITDDKARLGFFSFSSSFGRNMDDWIEGIRIREMNIKKVN